MMECEYIGSCIILNRSTNLMSDIVSLIRSTYCETDKWHCARYKVLNRMAKGYKPLQEIDQGSIQNIVDSIYPNEHSKAELILRNLAIPTS